MSSIAQRYSRIELPPATLVSSVTSNCANFVSFEKSELQKITILAVLFEDSMAVQTSGVAENLLDVPHVEGRRISVLQLRDRVEEVGDSPQVTAADYDLDLAVVYQALAYYHTHPEKMAAVREARKAKTDAHREEIAANRPDGVTPH